MAVTSGSFISASNPTQAPASSSSVTPSSTSQSSGTPVVPSFISTNSTLGGPSVVSTLSASSAEHLVIFQRLSCVLLWFYLLSSRVCQVLVICCVFWPFVCLDRFLSLLPLTWIDSSMNSAIILTQTKLHTWSKAFVMVFT